MGDARFPTFLDADLARIEIGERFTRPPDDDVIPKSGNAKYAGIMIVGLREEDGRAAGAVTLDVSFLGDGIFYREGSLGGTPFGPPCQTIRMGNGQISFTTTDGDRTTTYRIQ